LKIERRVHDGVDGAQIEGGFSKAFKLMIESYLRNGRELKGKVIVLNCADGAAHTVRLDQETNMCLFNSQIWSKSMKEEFSTASSLNIFMYLQINTDEKLEYIENKFVKVQKHIAKLKKEFNIDAKVVTYCFYKCDDAKFLYVLTQHSQWTRIHYPFLHCSCKRGIGV